LPEEDPKSITGINQPHSPDEYKYKSYEELSQKFQAAAGRAFELIHQMYNRLTLVDNLTHKDALEKIHNDHVHLRGFTPRNIRRYLPANNPNIPRRVRTSRPKNSGTETCVGTSFSDTISDTGHNDEKNINQKIGTQSTSNQVVDDISSDRTIQIEDVTSKRQTKSDKANLKTNVLNQEIALPCRESLRYISSQLNKGKNEFCISIKVNLDTGKIISVKIGRNSEQETNSFRNIY
jgi:hypothetical protein